MDNFRTYLRADVRSVSSFPLLLTQLLQLLSTSETALGHLRWRSLDTVAAVSRRATEYIVLNLLIVTAARYVPVIHFLRILAVPLI